MKQVLAVIVAALMVGGAFYVRTEVLSDAGDVPSADGGGAEVAGDAAGDLEVVCDDVLGDACPAGSTRLGVAGIIDAFADRAALPDVLVAPSAVVAMVDGSGRSAATFEEGAEVVASTPLVLLASGSTGDTLAAACGPDVSWACVSDAVAAGDLRPGFADPSRSSDGIAALAALAGGYVERSGGSFSAGGFATGGFIGWLDGVRRQAVVAPGAAANLVRFNGAQNDTALVTEAEGSLVVDAGGAQAMGIEVAYPTPVVVLEVVVARVAGVDDDAAPDLGPAVAEALRGSGWRGPDGAPPGPGAPQVDGDDDGLPDGGVLVALQQRWG